MDFFFISFEKIQFSVKCDKNNQCFTCRPIYINDCILLHMFQTKVVEKIRTHLMFINYLKNHVIDEIMWKNLERAGLAIDGKMAHAHCMLYT